MNEGSYSCAVPAFCTNDNYRWRHHHFVNRRSFFFCKVCHKNFAQKCHLKRHMLIHSGERPFKCSICVPVRTNTCLVSFAQTSVNGESIYFCTYCSYSTIRKADLKGHIRIHTGERPYQCNLCSKKFRRNCDLQRHKIVHDKGLKQYSSDIYSKQFS